MNLTQVQLAQKADLSEKTIRRMEQAEKPGDVSMSERSVIKLIRALNISPEEVEAIFDLLIIYPELKGIDEQRTEH